MMNSLFLVLAAAAGCVRVIHAYGESGSGQYCESGALRLVDGFDSNSGRVEFCHEGEWGTVCDDDWDENDARVACRQLELPSEVVYALSGFGGGNGSIFIDNSACSGEEQRLDDCIHNLLGVHNCPLDHSHDAGVICDSDVNEVCAFQEASINQECSESADLALVTRSCLQKYGNCVPYHSQARPGPCDDVFESGVDYVYVSHSRYGGSFSRFMDNIIKFGPQLLATLESCYDIARQVICHFYLPPCGNSTHFASPTSVCRDTCLQLHDLCPTEWDVVVSIFEQNKILLEADGLFFIDCEDTGAYLSPIPHCCTHAGVNSSITVTPLLNYSTNATTTVRTDIIVYAYVAGPVALVLAVIITVVTIRLCCQKHYKLENFTISNPIPLGRQTCKAKDRCTTVNRYIEPNIAIRRTAKTPRMTSAYIRQMAENEMLISRNNIKLMASVGQGEFGIVYKAYLYRSKKGSSTVTELVAVKTLKGDLSGCEVDKLVEESVIMSRFNHHNIMKLIGVCIEDYNTLYIVMPFMTHGSLLSYLRKDRAQLTIDNEDNHELVDGSRKKLLSICLQITKGMEYLANQKFVHRDLAARNCMIDENFVIKVADFGLSEDVYARNYFRQGRSGEDGETPVKLPVKWMALESLNDGIFSEKTDIWSFGVTCWEVFALGKKPYPGIDPFSLIKYLERGERLEKPPNAACSLDIYGVMMDCWKEEHEERPTFTHLVNTFSSSLEEMAGYMDFTSLTLNTEYNMQDS